MASPIEYWRNLRAEPQPVVLPGIWDAFSARVVEHAGIRAAVLGGYHVGAALGSAEPLLSARELVLHCLNIRRATSLPMRVDVGAGFGDPIHVVQLVKDLMLVGVEAISIEDQVYPKQAHYHNDYQERLISMSAMVSKIEWARKTTDDRMYINGRTDAFSQHGQEEAVERCLAYFEAGADSVQAFPRTMEEAEALPSLLPGPVWYANTRGNRVGRPDLTPQQARDLGYIGLVDGHALFFAAYAGIRRCIDGFAPADGFRTHEDELEIRKEIEAVKGLDELYEIERQTVLADDSHS